jgi:hypothetical protein
MGAYDNLLRCTVGGTSFQLEDYELRKSPIIKAGIGRTGIEVALQGVGWVESSDSPSDFATKVADAHGKLLVSGQDFSIHNFDAKVFEVLAAHCADVGPHIGFEQLPGSEGNLLLYRFRFELSAILTADFGGGTTAASLYEESIQTAADGLRRVTRRGEFSINGASAVFLNTIVPAFRLIYGVPQWVVSHEYETDAADRTLSYTITANELRSPLPSADANVVDGDGRIFTERDEQSRLTTTWDFRLILSDGNYQPVIDAVRAEIAAKGAIVRERVQVMRFARMELILIYEQLRSGENNNLLNWEATLEILNEQMIWEVPYVPGVSMDPEIIKVGTAGPVHLVQSGYAVGYRAWPKAPDPLFPDDLEAAASVKYSVANDFERVTAWNYQMVLKEVSAVALEGMLRSMQRPSHPIFVGNVPIGSPGG